MPTCIDDAHNARSSHALRIEDAAQLLHAFCRRVLVARRSARLLTIVEAEVLSRIVAEAA